MEEMFVAIMSDGDLLHFDLNTYEGEDGGSASCFFTKLI